MEATVIPMPRAALERQYKPREDKNLRYNNDGSLASVEGLLHKLAIKCYGRVQGMGLGMEFDDVKQEMYISYIKATQCWNAQHEKKSLFSTYCTTVCLNNFNHAIKKMERQRAIGKIEPTEDVPLTQDGAVKFQRPFGMVSECEYTELDDLNVSAFMDTARAPVDCQPEARLERSQTTRQQLATLSPGARTLVALLLEAEKKGSEAAPRLRDLARDARLDGAELKRVKQEILTTFGVQWK